jgi:hypothetical protein
MSNQNTLKRNLETNEEDGGADSKKMKFESDEEEFPEEISDTKLALQLLKNQVQSAVDKINFPPIILKYMLTHLLDKNIKLEEEIQELVKKNEIRQFKVHSFGKDEVAFIFYEDYMNYLKFIIKEDENKVEYKYKDQEIDFNQNKKMYKIKKDHGELLKKFEKILKVYFKISISKEELTKLVTPEEAETLLKLGMFTLKDEREWFGKK